MIREIPRPGQGVPPRRPIKLTHYRLFVHEFDPRQRDQKNCSVIGSATDLRILPARGISLSARFRLELNLRRFDR